MSSAGHPPTTIYGDQERRRNAVSIRNSIEACQHYCKIAYNSPTAYWAQLTASQGYSIQSLLAAVLHHSWTVSCTFGLHSHSTDCDWTTSSSAATSVGGALCYSISCDRARKNDAWPTSSGSRSRRSYVCIGATPKTYIPILTNQIAVFEESYFLLTRDITYT